MNDYFHSSHPSLRGVTCLAAMLAASISCNAFAGVVTDGSVGAVHSISGLGMTIPESWGRLSGNNLFHSFQAFNILGGESANFTTTTSGIANVISRVTGGSLSQINGQLKLTPASGAPNFFFINPAGVTFGAGASIDVPGAFHVSTADYIKFPDGNFHAGLGQASTFSVASPEAFGFLGTTRASITVNGGATLSTQPLQPISIVGSDVEINNGAVSTLDGGDIRVVALGQSAQEVGFTGTLPAANGNLALLNGGYIFSSTGSATNAGSVKVSAGSITLDRQGSGLFTGITSQANSGTGNAGIVEVSVTGNLSIVDGSEISSGTFSSGDAGSVKVSAGSIAIDGLNSLTGIFSNANLGSSGKAGTVNVIATGNLSIVNGGEIASSTYSTGALGDAGSVAVDAGSIGIDGQGSLIATGIFSSTLPGSAGKAGTIDITAAGNLSIVNGGMIYTNTLSSGNAGSVTINAGSITIDNQSSLSMTGIFSDANLGSGGNAGTVDVTTSGNLSLLNGGHISSSTYSSGVAGSVVVRTGTLLADGGIWVGGIFYPSRISAAAEVLSSGQTGDVSVTTTDSITLSNGGQFSIQNKATAGMPSALTPTSIGVTAPRITILNSPNAITTASTGNVDAGSIMITASDRLYLDPSGITTTSNLGNGGAIDITAGILRLDNSQIATSVLGLTGNGGNITINANSLILNTGFILADTAAPGASGGTVLIAAQNLIPSGNTLFLGGNTPYAYQPGIFGFNVIQAAAPTGVSGSVQTTTPVLDVSGSLSGLNTQVLDTGGLGRNPCQTTGGSSLAQSGRGGLPPSARGLLRTEPNLSPIRAGFSSPADAGDMHLASSNWGCS